MTDQPITPEPAEPQVEAAVPDNPPPVVDTMPSLEESLRTAELKAAGVARLTPRPTAR